MSRGLLGDGESLLLRDAELGVAGGDTQKHWEDRLRRTMRGFLSLCNSKIESHDNRDE